MEQVFTQNEKLLKYLKQTIRIEEERRRMETLYKIVPPLLALNTLTNAASSYIAQYTQVAGHNATLGNTSISGAYALRSACQELNDHPEVVIAGASNSGGFYSYITLSRFFDPSHRWRESSGAVMFALTSGNEVSGNNDKPIAIIEDIRFSSSIPSVFNNARFDQLEEGTTIDPDSMIVFSGAYTDDIYRQQKELFENLSDECFSWFPYLGNVGSVTPLLNILAAALKLRSSKHERAVCIDKDPFGRESRITIKLAG